MAALITENSANRDEEEIFYARRAWGVVCLAGLVSAAVIACSLDLHSDWAALDKTHHLPFRLFLAFTLVCTMAALPRLWCHHAEKFWTKWWDPSLSKPDGSIEWSHVLEMTVGGQDADPLTFKEEFRRSYFKGNIFFHIILVAAMAMALVVVADRLLKWRLPAMIWADKADPGGLAGAVVNASGNLTAYLALLASIITIAFTYHQLRAKVRADNRQAWIDKARRLLAEIIEATDHSTDKARAYRNQRRIELELMLNPSEKDHRLLIYLIQCLCRVPDVDQIEPAQHLRDVVRMDLARKGKLPLFERVLDERSHGILISYVVRLSHAVLKREWERVKHTR